MKKIMNIFAVLFVAIALVACGNSSSIKKVDSSDIQTKIEAKESFITLVSSSTCAACKDYDPVIEEFQKENDKLTILDVQIDKIKNDDERTKFVNSYSLSATPTTMFIKEGKVVATKEGALTKIELKELSDQYLK